jgi:hypothetical protein
MMVGVKILFFEDVVSIESFSFSFVLLLSLPESFLEWTSVLILLSGVLLTEEAETEAEAEAEVEAIVVEKGI